MARLIILVTSAGFTENFDAILYPYERMKKLWEVHVDGADLFATGVAKHLIERKALGSIVMIGSISRVIVNVPQPRAPYNAAKSGDPVAGGKFGSRMGAREYQSQLH